MVIRLWSSGCCPMPAYGRCGLSPCPVLAPKGSGESGGSGELPPIGPLGSYHNVRASCVQPSPGHRSALCDGAGRFSAKAPILTRAHAPRTTNPATESIQLRVVWSVVTRSRSEKADTWKDPLCVLCGHLSSSFGSHSVPCLAHPRLLPVHRRLFFQLSTLDARKNVESCELRGQVYPRGTSSCKAAATPNVPTAEAAGSGQGKLDRTRIRQCPLPVFPTLDVQSPSALSTLIPLSCPLTSGACDRAGLAPVRPDRNDPCSCRGSHARPDASERGSEG